MIPYAYIGRHGIVQTSLTSLAWVLLALLWQTNINQRLM